ncbi:MAG TPA: transglutaminase family protein [Tepidisphaeraceae bacterium]|nr:transglutaminase family protein [Tepidisphaeraceae bacterium]
MADAELTTRPVSNRLSWAAIAAALVAMGALYCHATDYNGLALIALAMVGTRLTDFRMPKHLLLIWPLRILLFSAVIVAGSQSRARGAYWMFDPGYTRLFGYLCAAEMVVQVWQKRVGDAPFGEVLLLAALIMAVATNTYDPRYTQFLVPAYVLLLVLSFRSFNGTMSDDEKHRARRFILRRGVVIGLALAIGWTTAEGLRTYGEKITIYPLARIFKKVKSAPDMGISSSSRVRMAYSVKPSPVRVLRVEGKWGGGHLRGVSFDNYVNETWGPGLGERTFEHVGLEQLKSKAEGRRLRITRLVDDLNLLYVPLDAAGVTPAADSQTEWDKEQGRVIKSSLEDDLPYAYEVILGSLAFQGPICGPLDDQQRRRCLEVAEEIDPRVRELANKIAAGTADAKGRVQAVVDHLQATHQYSLSTQPAVGDPVCDFLLSNKAGHCQFFASGTVILLRCMGVPARLVTGYYVHESDGEGRMVVRQRDAHAWAECWIDGMGWITVDATPGSGRPDQAFAGIGFWQKLQEKVQDGWKAIQRWILEMDWKRAVVLCGGGIVLFMVTRWIWEWWRHRPRRVKMGRCSYPEGELAGVALGYERLLKRCGIPCSADQTWRENLAAAVESRGERLALDVKRLDAFMAEYDEVRFGQRADDQAVERLRELLKRLEISRRVR